MKLKIRYATKERKYISAHVFQNVGRDAELEPVRILRRPCGSGSAANRYYYQADFLAPEDAEFAYNGLIRENVNRITNPGFDPKKITWAGNTGAYNA